VAEKGGYIGIYFMPFLKPGGHAKAADVVAHLEHAIKVCGEDHVGIGTDGSVTPYQDLAALRKQQEAYVALRKAQGIAAPGESADDFFFVEELSGSDQFKKLAGLLEQRGHPASRVEKILGANFVRVAREVWGA
jgi:membrane dipeptidase